MSKVITFSRVFPAYHPKAGQSTYFVEKFLKANNVNWFKDYYFPMLCQNNPKLKASDCSDFIRSFNDGIREKKVHTIRNGNRWKVGDKFSPRVWSGNPYQSKQIVFAPDTEIKQIFDFEIANNEIYINGQSSSFENLDVAINDGLDYKDLLAWFKFPKPFKGQIICWSDAVSYGCR